MHQGKFLLLTQSVNREAGSSVSLLTIMVAVLHVAPDLAHAGAGISSVSEYPENICSAVSTIWQCHCPASLCVSQLFFCSG